MNKKTILIGLGVLAFAGAGIGYYMWKKKNENSTNKDLVKKTDKSSNTLENKADNKVVKVDNSVAVDDLKTKIKSLGSILLKMLKDVKTLDESSERMSKDDYRQVRNERADYVKKLEQLGWKMFGEQQKDGSFLDQFITIEDYNKRFPKKGVK